MDKKMYDKGLEVRRAVLGADYVDQALAKTDEFSQPFQDILTEFCWGAVWGRPGLDRRTRSLINLAMLTALNRPAELKLHLKGALRNGCSVQEIQEVLLQTVAYCGFPAALESFKVAKEVLAEEGKDG